MLNKSQDADDFPITEIFSWPISGTTDVPKIFSLFPLSKYTLKKQDLPPSPSCIQGAEETKRAPLNRPVGAATGC